MSTFSTLASSWRCSLVLILLCGSLAAARAQPQPTPVQATDLLKIRSIEAVQLSPDGRYAAYVQKRIVETPAADAPYAYRHQLYVVPTSGRDAPRLLTRTASATQPDWHPDGDLIAFVRPVDGTPQIFVMSTTGGAPYQLTSLPHGATRPRWSPNGQQLLFASTRPAPAVARALRQVPSFSERPGRSPRDTLWAPPADTVLVLRDAATLAPRDTLNLPLRPDTSARIYSQTLAPRLDTLRAVPPDSLQSVLDSLRLVPDTLAIKPPRPPATPDGTLPQVRRWLAQRQARHNPKVITRLDFQGEHALRPDASFRHLYTVRLPNDLLQETPPRPQPRLLTPYFRSFYDAAWLPTGRQLVVSAPPATSRHPDRVRARSLYFVDVQARTVRRLLHLEHYALSAPRVTADGTQLAFVARDLRDAGYAQNELGLFALDGRSKPQLITRAFDRSLSAPKWSPAGWYLYATAPSEGGVPLYRFAPFAQDSTRAPYQPPTLAVSRDSFVVDSTLIHDVAPEQLVPPTQGVRAFDATDATVVYARTTPRNPYALYVNTVSFTGEELLANPNAWIAQRQLASMRPFTVQSDSFTIDAWLMRPPGPVPPQGAPLLVEMHGGPMAMWGPGEATMWHEFQYLAGRGYAIVFANPRGSGGYGRAFKAANFQNWGPGPMQDVLAAVDAVVDSAGIDASRQVLTGGSYAGYLTAWMVSQTDRFDAAVAQRGVYDLSTFFGEGNAWRLVPWHFGGYPWNGAVPAPAGRTDSTFTATADSAYRAVIEHPPVDSLRSPPRAALLRNSPQTYAPSIHTPLLIMHADDDLRTGVVQSEMLYKSLKVLGRPVEYVRYPNAGHDLSRTGAPAQRIDRLLRIYEFLARYAPPRAAP
ncbi:S9 family peptidase [Salisaeta longa]|uniref:S9 family peptidase n=1 Tax=Salisaeta longa TaxID=503170 RepID=UPI0003B3EEDE|nr:S9 family peptidase [Salisaeta longa]